MKFPQILHIHKNHNFCKYTWKEIDQLLLPSKFYVIDM